MPVFFSKYCNCVPQNENYKRKISLFGLYSALSSTSVYKAPRQRILIFHRFMGWFLSLVFAKYL